MIVEIEEVESLPLHSDHTRSEGVHVSEIIRCIATETGILKTELVEELSLLSPKDMSGLDIISQLRIHMGTAWDLYYIPRIKGVQFHPGEFCVDGIYMTPDGVEQSVYVTGTGPIKRRRKVTIVHEIKFTYKSVNTVGDFSEQFMWLAQIKSYCKAAKTNRAIAHVLFVCGDYSWPQSPRLIKYHLTFDDREIEDNWDLMTQYRDERMEIEGVA